MCNIFLSLFYSTSFLNHLKWRIHYLVSRAIYFNTWKGRLHYEGGCGKPLTHTNHNYGFFHSCLYCAHPCGYVWWWDQSPSINLSSVWVLDSRKDKKRKNNIDFNPCCLCIVVLKWSRRSPWAMKATSGFWWGHVACAFSTVGFDKCNPPPLISSVHCFLNFYPRPWPRSYLVMSHENKPTTQKLPPMDNNGVDRVESNCG